MGQPGQAIGWGSPGLAPAHVATWLLPALYGGRLLRQFWAEAQDPILAHSLL